MENMINIPADIVIAFIGMSFIFMVWSFYAMYKWYKSLKEVERLEEILYLESKVDTYIDSYPLGVLKNISR